LLEGVVAEPERPIGDFSLVTPKARALLPDPSRPLPPRWAGSVVDRFVEQAARHPEKIAVTAPGESWTYRELDQASAALAYALRRGGVGQGDVVAIEAYRDPRLLVAVLATLRAGGSFLLLDAAYPPEMLAERVAIAAPRAVIRAAKGNRAVIPLPEGSLPFPLGEKEEILALSDGEVLPEILIGPDDLAYLAFTSGSTGRPKGIVGTHRPLSHFFAWYAETFEVGEEDRFSMFSGLSHDPLLRDLFAPLWLGATLVIPDPAEIGTPGYLTRWMLRERITVTHLTPAFARLLEISATAKPQNGNAEPLEELRYAFLSGDVLHPQDVERIRGLAPAVRIVNFYGATETPQGIAAYPVPEEIGENPAAIPIGRGIEGVDLLVLTKNDALAAPGEIGEICVRTPYLTRGYLGDESLTREKFRPNPFTNLPDDRIYHTGDLGYYDWTGNVVFLGRRDDQVKIRGFRIELDEIRRVLRRHPAIHDVEIVLDAAPSGENRLLAYYVAEHVLPLAQLRSFLAPKLPDYMIPSRFVHLDAFPLTPNGKIDRKALPRPDAHLGGAAPFMPPRTPYEEALTEIWREILDTEKIGIHDNFFELGGHSLLATQLFGRIRETFQVELSIRAIFEAPT
ncbi:MAG: amino acid adenylation domain-containing protein, partial [Deltaproteobacteria bacterium]